MAASTFLLSNQFANSTIGPYGQLQFWNGAFYDELRRRASYLLRRHHGEDHVDPEDLVHDAYLRLAHAQTETRVNDASHFFALVTRAMKRVLIDHVRTQKTSKRFGQLTRSELPLDIADSDNTLTQNLWINDLLEKAGPWSPRHRSVIKMHFFENRTIDEMGALLCVSGRTVKRDLRAITREVRSRFYSTTNRASTTARSC